ncbi:NADPH-dependent F420 reductase [Spirosoma linguale]|uniref:NADP oxidoreductase coenzyme F420-dependent n=1 Tax=Spirosoma linguale (strain ATCC 33905 / DSM 74 / LMG 10896 / Claus 1) TaxID=504472 RepID=D2QC63_SPILD|nr:NADP oxidoreductase coenzyme F420-dependent [Spirosoma linguale DSM 74]
MSSTIGIIGSGHIGRGLATHLAKTTYPVLITNRRGPASLTDLVASIGGSLSAADLTQTIEQADVLFIAAPWTQLPELAGQLQGYSGKILVDATNNIVSVSPFQLADTAGKPTGEHVASLFPTHRVVKAFNTLPAATLAQPSSGRLGNTVIVISGDDGDAKKEVADITKAMGFAPVDLGTFQQGGHLQDMGGALSGAEFIKVSR